MPSGLPTILIDSCSTFWDERNSFVLRQLVHPGCQKTRTTSSMNFSFAATANPVAKIMFSRDRLWAEVRPNQRSRIGESGISQIAIKSTATIADLQRRCNCFPSTAVRRPRSGREHRPAPDMVPIRSIVRRVGREPSIMLPCKSPLLAKSRSRVVPN